VWKRTLEDRQVFCLGHISVDVFIHRTDLIDLRIGGCISSPNLSILGGGVAANVAYWLGSLGTRVSMVGVISDDPSGLMLRNDLEKVGVNCILKISEQNPSASILVIVEENGERSFIINGDCLDELTLDDVPLDEFQKGDLLYTSAYNIEKSPIKDTIKELLISSKRNGSNQFEIMFNLAAYTTVENFKKRILEDVLPYVDILIGNYEEYCVLSSDSSETPLLSHFSLLTGIKARFPNLKLVILTDGEKGCFFSAKGENFHFSANHITIVDSTGAGDGFTAGFISGYINDLPIKDCVKKGTDLAGNICQGYGARFSLKL